MKGLGTFKDKAALPVLMDLLSSGDRNVLIETVRALGRIGDPSAAQPLLKIIRDAAADPQVRRARVLLSTPRRASARDVVAPTAVSDACQSV